MSLIMACEVRNGFSQENVGGNSGAEASGHWWALGRGLLPTPNSDKDNDDGG